MMLWFLCTQNDREIVVSNKLTLLRSEIGAKRSKVRLIALLSVGKMTSLSFLWNPQMVAVSVCFGKSLGSPFSQTTA
jgi:hypothetical protein